MNFNIRELDEIKLRLKPKLRSFLEKEGISIDNNGFFSCIDPNHDDKTPSCRLLPDLSEEQYFCYGCLDENELIWTDHGLEPIKNIAHTHDKYDYVLNGAGNWEKTTNKIITYNRKDILGIGLLSFRHDPLILTEDHTCVVVKRSDACKAFPFIQPQGNRPNGIKFYGRLKGLKKSYKYTNSAKITECPAIELEEGDFFMFPVIKLRDYAPLRNTNIIKPYTKGPRTSKIKELPVNKKLARLYGLYIAEGSAPARSVNFTFHINEEHTLAKEVKQILLEEFNLKSTINLIPEKNVCSVVCSKVDLCKQLKYWFGAGAENKKIPVEALSWPEDIQRSLIFGYMDGDGHKRYSATTVSKELAYGLYAIAVQARLLPSISYRSGYIDKDNVSHRERWNLKLKKLEGLCGFFEEVHGVEYYFSCINKISSMPPRNVVDITVGNGSTFTTKLGAVHNCQTTGDIFSAAHILKGWPIEGIGFIEDNIYKLAEYFDIEYQKVKFTEEQLTKIEFARIFRAVHSLLAITDVDGNPVGWTLEHALKRGWNEATCKTLGVSTILNYDTFLENVQRSTGISKPRLIQEFEIIPELFGPDRITITLFDYKANPVGFAGRFINFRKTSKVPKYRNSRNSPIFTKSDYLYNLQFAKRNTARRLDIFEGYGSVITSMGEGHTACVATCGTAFTAGQVELILNTGFNHINIVADPDENGLRAAYQHMEELQGKEGLKVTLTLLDDECDADDYIRKNGLPKFLSLVPITAFDFFLDKESKLAESSGIDKAEFAHRMIKLIINTSSKLEQGNQVKRLAKITGFDEGDIRSEIERLVNNEARLIKDQLLRALSRTNNADEILEVVEDFRPKLDMIDEAKNDKYILGRKESENALLELASVLKSRDVGIQGWKTGYDVIDRKISGVPKPMGIDEHGQYIAMGGALMGIAGAPQNCKTAIIQNLIVNMAENNDDIAQLVWSLDDSRKRFIERLIAIISGVKWTAVTKRVMPSPEEEILIADAVNKLQQWTIEGKLIVKDHSAGSTLNTLSKWIHMMQDELSKPVLAVVDSFHKIGASNKESSKTDFSITKAHSQECKRMAAADKISLLATIELNKTQGIGQEPHLAHITEARKIEYDFDVIATTYNAYYDLEGSTSEVLKNPNTGAPMPIIKLNIRKSKEGGSGPVWLVYDMSNFRMQCFDTVTINSMKESSIIDPIQLAGGYQLTTPLSRANSNTYEKW